jgi:hypothetical protein
MDPTDYDVGDTFQLGLAEHEVTFAGPDRIVLENGVVVTNDSVEFPDDVKTFTLGG